MTIGDYSAQKPRLQHLIEDENPTLAIFLRGHLVIEEVLRQLLLTTSKVSKKKLTEMAWVKKVDFAVTLKLISHELGSFLIEVNRLRNRFGHRLGYDLKENDVQGLISLAGKAPDIDFTDDFHNLSTQELYDWYSDKDNVLLEMFKHVALDLGFLVMENGGELLFED